MTLEVRHNAIENWNTNQTVRYLYEIQVIDLSKETQSDKFNYVFDLEGSMTTLF